MRKYIRIYPDGVSHFASLEASVDRVFICFLESIDKYPCLTKGDNIGGIRAGTGQPLLPLTGNPLYHPG